MKNKFLQISCGIAVVIFSVAILIRSFQPAQAAPAPQEFIQNGTNSIGKYQMTMQVANDPDAVYFYAVIWNTETGESTIYNRDTKTRGPWLAWTEANQLPTPKK